MTQSRALPILCLDFDGVIHAYSRGWQDGSIYDSPVEGTGEMLLRYLAKYRVSIFSSRSKSLRGRWAMKRYVRSIIVEACFDNSDAADEAWSVQIGQPADWRPWTGGDVQDQAHEVFASIRWPLFKPPALITIDDRALMFTGNWADFTPEKLAKFQPWNARNK